MTDWKSENTSVIGIEEAICLFKKSLPGWWYSVGECQVSCDASCGPTRESEHINLISVDRRFDDGFHADLPQPSSMTHALFDVLEQARKAIQEHAG